MNLSSPSSPSSSSNFTNSLFGQSMEGSGEEFFIDDGQSQQIDEQEMHARATIKLAFCIAYGILFVLGTLGNGLVIVMICNVLSTLSRTRRKVSRKLLMASAEHVFIYVLGLSIVDLFVILHLPLLIFEMREGQWPFGEFMCKLYWFGESVNKLLSSFLMTVLSWDRYMAVCSPIKSMKMRTNSVALSVLLGCSLFATLLLYPVLKESTVLRVNKLTGLRLVEEEGTGGGGDADQAFLHSSSSSIDDDEPPSSGIDNDQQSIVLKCVFDTNSPLFMLYTFGVGFLIPALLITFFYLRVILKLRSDAISVRKHAAADGGGPTNWSALSSARFHKIILVQVTKRIVAVILFYFFCWTPYWILNLASQFGIIIVSWSTLTLSSVFFGAHLLVCFNSAANPVLYALINRELRQQHAQAVQKRRRSLHLATNTALGFFEKQFPSSASKPRVASVGCTDDAHLRLLGSGLLTTMRGGTQSMENGAGGGLDKNRSCSFSHSTPALYPFIHNNKKLFGSNKFLQLDKEEEEEPGPEVVVEASGEDSYL